MKQDFKVNLSDLKEYLAEIPYSGPYTLPLHTGGSISGIAKNDPTFRLLLALAAALTDDYMAEHPELIGNPNAYTVALLPARSLFKEYGFSLTKKATKQPGVIVRNNGVEVYPGRGPEKK